MKKIAAVCFDLDGVICDTSQFHYQAWRELAASIGIQIDSSFNERLKGRSREDSLRDILVFGGKLADFTVEEREKLAEQKNQIYLHLISGVNQRNLFPGILSLLQDLKNADIKIALASASRNAPLLLKKLGIGQYFQGIANPEKVKLGKPAPDLYLAAAAAVGANPRACIGLEDALAGIKAILAAQMVPIGVGVSLKSEVNRNIPVVELTQQLTLNYLKEIFKKTIEYL